MSSWIVLILCPASRRCVARLCRRVWQLAGFEIPDFPKASLIILWRVLGWIWWYRSIPLKGWTTRLLEGNTHYQPHSLLAFGYFFSNSSGNVVPLYPFAKSWSCNFLIFCRWIFRDSLILFGNIVVLSFSPFTARMISKLFTKSMSLTLNCRHSRSQRPLS